MMANINDKAQAWDLLSDDSYKRIKVHNSGFSAHHYFMTNPSLSGVGQAIKDEQNKTTAKNSKDKN